MGKYINLIGWTLTNEKLYFLHLTAGGLNMMRLTHDLNVLITTRQKIKPSQPLRI